jgi:hypothetical protein
LLLLLLLALLLLLLLPLANSMPSVYSGCNGTL